MWTPSEGRRWIAPAALAGVALGLAAALGSVPEPPAQPSIAPDVTVAISGGALGASAGAFSAAPAGASATAFAVAHASARGAIALDVLREDTIMGEPRAGLALVGALLDRYESGGNNDDLYEAVQWMDRGWAHGHYQQSGLATRVFERHCTQGAMRWHWLCEMGE